MKQPIRVKCDKKRRLFLNKYARTALVVAGMPEGAGRARDESQGHILPVGGVAFEYESSRDRIYLVPATKAHVYVATYEVIPGRHHVRMQMPKRFLDAFGISTERLADRELVFVLEQAGRTGKPELYIDLTCT